MDIDRVCLRKNSKVIENKTIFMDFCNVTCQTMWLIRKSVSHQGWKTKKNGGQLITRELERKNFGSSGQLYLQVSQLNIYSLCQNKSRCIKNISYEFFPPLSKIRRLYN